MSGPPRATAAFPADEVAEFGVSDGYTFSRNLVTVWPSPLEQVEAIQGLGAQFIAQQIEIGRRGVAICGASQGVGVTFVATNAAVALAQAGVSTILIDANLHDPGVHELIAPREPVPGLEQALRADRLGWSDAIQAEVLPNLSVIFAGGPASDAAELLGGAAFQDLVKSCLRDFQFTIIDTPAANRWADARSICKAVGYSLVVARRNQSYVDDLATLARELADDGTTIVGALLNAV